MKTIRLALAIFLSFVFILAPLSVITGCKADDSGEGPLQTGAPLGGAISSAGLDMLLGGLAKGALSWAGGLGCEYLFGFIIGSEDDTAATLDDIETKLGEMDAKLDEILTIVKDIQEKVDEISAEIEGLRWQVATGSIAKEINIIDTAYLRLITLSESLKNTIGDTTHPEYYREDLDDVKALSLATGDILKISDSVLSSVNLIADSMIPGKFGGDSLLKLRREAVEKGLNYANAANRYDALALFFTAVLGEEVKGVELIVNAYAGQNRPDRVIDYLTTFYEDKLVPQVNEFSKQVKELVWGNANMSWSEVVLDQIGQPDPFIFPSADLLANSLLNSYDVDEEGNLKTSENKPIITARVRYSTETKPLSSIQFINISSNPQQIFTIQSEQPTQTEINSNVREYKIESPPNGTYKLYTMNNPDILHDYGEKEIIINDGIRVGSIGVYAWAPSSGWYQIENSNSKKIIETIGKKSSDNIHQWIYYGLDNQLWKFEHVGDGYYKITNKYSDMVLDVQSYGTKDGANVIQYPWKTTTNQIWRLHILRDGHLSIISKNSGKVLDIKDGTTGNGGNLQQFKRRDAGSQTFDIKLVAKPGISEKIVWKFIPQSKKDFRLDVRGGYGQGSVIQAYKKNSTKAQQWKVKKYGDYYQLIPECDTTTAASVRANSTLNGAIIQTWGKGNTANFLWKFEPVGNGYYKIINKNSKKVMEETTTAIHQINWGDAKDKKTVTWEIIKH